MSLYPQNAATRELGIQIAALREAQACITDKATPAEIYGRLDDLIVLRMKQLEAASRELCASTQRAAQALCEFAEVSNG